MMPVVEVPDWKHPTCGSANVVADDFVSSRTGSSYENAVPPLALRIAG